MFAELADLYHKAGSWEQAIPLYGKALDADPKNTALMFSLADCQAKTGKVAEATVSYEQALAMNSSEIKEYKTLGDLYMQQKKPDDALSAYKISRQVPGRCGDSQNRRESGFRRQEV